MEKLDKASRMSSGWRAQCAGVGGFYGVMEGVFWASTIIACICQSGLSGHGGRPPLGRGKLNSGDPMVPSTGVVVMS